jgi:hypothetical protein
VNKRSNTYLTAGRVLMKIKTNEMAEHGQVAEDYRQAIKQLKVEAAEAVNAEQVPPGDEDMIKKYFSNMDETVPPPDAPQAPATPQPAEE